MYWTGPFTDKPYLTLLSFLYTQNTALHNPSNDDACHPQLLVWINPGSASSMNTLTNDELYELLRTNQWAAPFLHPKFAETIQFKLWNTAERLDSIPELKDDWRHVTNLFNSGGHKLKVEEAVATDNGTVTEPSATETYDRLSVTLSDVARFVLCHSFGGVYIDADTVFLRDWEELWGWGGAFAYRWSFHNKVFIKLPFLVTY
jgi:WD repeat and SOF domain-containing protein 1